MKFKTAMDVRIGLPNEHLAGTARNEINQPMYATSVGLVMRGFEFLDTYHKTFDAGTHEEYVKPKATVPVDEVKEEEVVSEVEMEETEDEKVSLTDKIKGILTKMFEIEDQKIS